MINLRGIKRVAIVGGGTAGWFAALTLRRIFSPNVEVVLVESPDIGIIGVGEGGLINLVQALQQNQIPIDEFVRETGAAYKLGFVYQGWRDGGKDDQYYHLFAKPGIAATDWYEQGIYPLFSALIEQNIPLHVLIPGFSAIAQNASQQQATSMLANTASGLSASYHFDSHRVAKYLEKIAVSRGVIHRRAKVLDVQLNEQRQATALNLSDGQLAIDFLIDASGFARLVVGKQLETRWHSFSPYLLLDRAIPFHMSHLTPNPALLTRALAMNAGWMWQIPLVERVGAGYVFSSAHIDEQQALEEIERTLGFAINPMKTLRFTPGHFEQVWVGNMMALGLASGFVEPLEATSIGQMLEQLRNFERVLTQSQGVISAAAIADFNQANAKCWSGIRDFLRMHYDCPRQDTPFWRDATTAPKPESYQALKECFALRTPRMIDVQDYAINGWQGIFHLINWLFVAAPLGVTPPSAARLELMALPDESKKQLRNMLQERL